MYPIPILKQIAEAERIERAIRRQQEKYPPGGRPSTTQTASFPAFSGDTEEELITIFKAYLAAVGKNTRGNKRLGRKTLFADLVTDFWMLKKHGVTLPRHKHLSKKACEYGLGETLRKHGLTIHSDKLLTTNSRIRLGIAKKHHSLFARVSDAIEKKLPP